MKKLFHIKIFTFSALLALIVSACEDVVQVGLGHSDIDLVSVEAYINTKARNNIYVKLEYTLPVDQAETNPPIHNAVVTISDDAGEPNTVTLEEYNSTGIYILPQRAQYIAETGRNYQLHITLPDGVEISGSDYLQAMEPLDSVKVNLSARGDYEYLAVFINTQETPGPGDYYKWDIFINGAFLYESQNLMIASDEFVEGNYIYDFEIFTDFALDDEDKVLLKGDTVTVEQSSISKTAYDFYTGMLNQAFSGSPYSVPPANLPGNLISSDGKKVLGIFSARDVSVGNIVIIGDSNYQPLASRVPGSN